MWYFLMSFIVLLLRVLNQSARSHLSSSLHFFFLILCVFCRHHLCFVPYNGLLYSHFSYRSGRARSECEWQSGGYLRHSAYAEQDSLEEASGQCLAAFFNAALKISHVGSHSVPAAYLNHDLLPHMYSRERKKPSRFLCCLLSYYLLPCLLPWYFLCIGLLYMLSIATCFLAIDVISLFLWFLDFSI